MKRFLDWLFKKKDTKQPEEVPIPTPEILRLKIPKDRLEEFFCLYEKASSSKTHLDRHKLWSFIYKTIPIVSEYNSTIEIKDIFEVYIRCE